MKRLTSLLLTSAASLFIATPAQAQWAMTCTREYNSSVNLRNQPSTRASVIASIPNESYLRALTWVWGGDNLRWWKVEFNGLIGWMRSDYLCR
jgi:uncharacterized protein YraI